MNIGFKVTIHCHSVYWGIGDCAWSESEHLSLHWFTSCCDSGNWKNNKFRSKTWSVGWHESIDFGIDPAFASVKRFHL